MALSISQITAASYPAVLAKARKPENQFSDTSTLREFERQKFIQRKSLGPTIEAPLAYKRNPQGAFLTTSLQTTSLTRTDVITAASYTVAELSVPVTWSKRDEVENPSENQKIALSKSLLTNGFDSHDDLIEEAFYAATATNGFSSFLVIIPANGQGTVGGINSATETWWRSVDGTYLADGSDMEAAMTTRWNEASKGSGSGLMPTLVVSDDPTQALFESGQQAQQRYVDTQDLKVGFKTIAFKSARYIFSEKASTKIFMMNPKSLTMVVSQEYFRDKGETQEIDDANGFSFKIYSALQLVTNNKSRLVHLDTT